MACCLFLAGIVLTAIPWDATAQGASVSAADLISGKPHQLPIAGMVTMVDIGAHSCIPCKMMTPIIESLSQEYDGRAVIAFIDVWEHREEASKYGISSIPTQVFYDARGKEQYRHVGFLDKESIIAKLTELGVK
jgi:thioredoxin 1